MSTSEETLARRAAEDCGLSVVGALDEVRSVIYGMFREPPESFSDQQVRDILVRVCKNLSEQGNESATSSLALYRTLHSLADAQRNLAFWLQARDEELHRLDAAGVSKARMVRMTGLSRAQVNNILSGTGRRSVG